METIGAMNQINTQFLIFTIFPDHMWTSTTFAIYIWKLQYNSVITKGKKMQQ